jgi:AbrB family looped-hinge helix DNA binding protein
MLVRLSSKGQLVIPKPVREALGLEPGTQFQLEVQEERIVLEPVVPSVVDRLYAKYADSDLLADLEAEHRQELEDEQAGRA